MSANAQNDFLVAPETVESCPNCGGTDLRVWRKSYDRLHRVSRQEFVYSRCLRCDLVFLSSRPFETDAHKFYPSDYGPYQSSGSQRQAVGPYAKSSLGFIKGPLLKAVRALNTGARPVRRSRQLRRGPYLSHLVPGFCARFPGNCRRRNGPPPAEPLRSEVLTGTLRAMAEVVPALRALDQDTLPETVVKGGVIVAWGATDRRSPGRPVRCRLRGTSR